MSYAKRILTLLLSFILTLSAGSGTRVMAANAISVSINGPSDLEVNEGDNVSLSVSASATPPSKLYYQWNARYTSLWSTAVSVTGETSSGLNLGSIKFPQDGFWEYYCTVSDKPFIGGNPTSASSSSPPIFVGVTRKSPPPTITTQPASMGVKTGGTAVFKVAAKGSGTLTYQWKKAGNNVATGTGANTDTYSIAGVSATDAGSYTVEVRSSGGSPVVSNPALLTVVAPPLITTQPVSLSVNDRSPAAFSVSATGTQPLTFQWKKNGSNISGGTQQVFKINAATISDSGTYSVVVTNSAGSLASSEATLTVKGLAPTITSQSPATPTSVVAGSSAVFSVSATGTAQLTYQWRKDGGDIPLANSSTLKILSAGPADAGKYSVLVSNPAGSVSSKETVLTVNTPVTFTTPPAGASAYTGGSATFTVVVAGTPPFTYQWKKGGVNIGSPVTTTVNSSTYTVAPVKTTDAGAYSVSVTNAAGSVTSSSCTLAVSAPPATINVVRQPLDANFIKGNSTTIPVEVSAGLSNAANTSYQLYFFDSVELQADPLVLGLVPSSGVLNLPLKQVSSSGQYIVRFKRTFTDGTTATVDTDPFELTMSSWDDAAGTYEMLLENASGVYGDGAKCRGLLSVSVTRTGYASGRLQYVESAPLSGGESLGLRSYVPVVRTFTCNYVPVAGDRLKVSWNPVFGPPAKGRQDLVIEMDFAADPVSMRATVKDHVSVGNEYGADGLVSEAFGATRVLAQLKNNYMDASGVVGRYVVSADSASAPGAATDSRDMYQLIQVLPSGRITWATRMYGYYSGTGSASLGFMDQGRYPGALAAKLYESKLTSTTSLFSSNVLLGQLNFVLNSSGVWDVSVGSDEMPETLENQSTCAVQQNVSGVLTPRYTGLQFSNGTNWTGVSRLQFSNENAVRWAGSQYGTIPSTFKGEDFVLSLVDSSALKTTYNWKVSIKDSVSGYRYLASAPTAVAVGIATDGVLPPDLTLQIDPLKGELTGSYTASGSSGKAVLFGSLVVSQFDQELKGQGWREPLGGVSVRRGDGSWQLTGTPGPVPVPPEWFGSTK